MSALLRIEDVSKNFGGIVAVENLTCELHDGEIMGIIGPNGAGKTTVFNLITGVYKPTSGKIIFLGDDITGNAPDLIVRKGIARTFQNIRLFKKLSVLNNVVTALDLNNPVYNIFEAIVLNFPFINSKVKRKEAELREKAMSFLDLVGIGNLAQKRADSLPYGLQRKLEIARALALNPRVLLLDEPAAGMNPEESMELARLIKDIQKKLGLTILLIEHHMDLVMSLCDKILVVNFGSELAIGAPKEIQETPAVLKAYLGEAYKGA